MTGNQKDRQKKREKGLKRTEQRQEKRENVCLTIILPLDLHREKAMSTTDFNNIAASHVQREDSQGGLPLVSLNGL